MELHADFTQPVAIDTRHLPWQDSPMQGVRRRMLDRVGAEVARATTIVSYAPQSHFSPHVHTGGEEFIVLEGVFQDEHGDYPVGTYVRNPPQSSHTPGSAAGCVIFVKLWQFDLADRTELRVDMNDVELQRESERDSVRSAVLFQDAVETVQLQQWEPDSHVVVDTVGGAELLVLDGEISDGGVQLGKHGWVRLPVGGRSEFVAGVDGVRLWVKTGHLVVAEAQGERVRGL